MDTRARDLEGAFPLPLLTVIKNVLIHIHDQVQRPVRHRELHPNEVDHDEAARRRPPLYPSRASLLVSQYAHFRM